MVFGTVFTNGDGGLAVILMVQRRFKYDARVALQYDIHKVDSCECLKTSCTGVPTGL